MRLQTVTRGSRIPRLAACTAYGRFEVEYRSLSDIVQCFAD